MKPYILFLLVLLPSICVFGQANPINPSPIPSNRELSAKEIAQRSLPSVALLICSDGKETVQGSGFFIKPGILITNYHVIEGMTKGFIQITVGEKKEKKLFRIAKIIAFDKESDLAVLSIPAAKEASVPFLALLDRNLPVEVGETVYALGNPEGLTGTISPGIVSANLRSQQKKARLQITAPISQGSSGGPVVNARGEVIGVAVGSLEVGQNLNFAVPISLVYSLITNLAYPSESENQVEIALYENQKSLKDWSSVAPNIVSAGKTPPISIIGPLRQGETSAQASLRKLEGVYLVVEDLDEAGKKLFDSSKFKPWIAYRLQKNGIKLFTREAWLNSSSIGLLSFELSTLQSDATGIFSYSYRLELNQDIRLERDPTFIMTAATWAKGSNGYAGRQVASDAISKAITDVLDKFCLDYLKANQP